jgi:hypothetical protein
MTQIGGESMVATITLDNARRAHEMHEIKKICKLSELLSVNVDIIFERTLCPICRRRIFDVHALTDCKINIRLKCLHCRKIVIFSLLGINHQFC